MVQKRQGLEFQSHNEGRGLVIGPGSWWEKSVIQKLDEQEKIKGFPKLQFGLKRDYSFSQVINHTWLIWLPLTILPSKRKGESFLKENKSPTLYRNIFIYNAQYSIKNQHACQEIGPNDLKEKTDTMNILKTSIFNIGIIWQNPNSYHLYVQEDTEKYHLEQFSPKFIRARA